MQLLGVLLLRSPGAGCLHRARRRRAAPRPPCEMWPPGQHIPASAARHRLARGLADGLGGALHRAAELRRTGATDRGSVERRAPLVVGPRWHDHVLEDVVRQRKELEHGQDKELDVGQEVCIVLHIRRRDQQLPRPEQREEPLAVAARDQLVPLAVDDDRRARDLWRGLDAREPLLDQGCEGADAVAEQLLDGQERCDEDQAREAEERRQPHSGPRADGAPKDLDAVQGPAQRVHGEVECGQGVLHHALAAGHAGADAVAGVLHGEDMHLELLPQVAAEAVAAPEVLRIAVKEDDEEARRGVRHQQARNALLIHTRRWRRAIIPEASLLGHPDEVLREAVHRVARLRRREEDARHEPAFQHRIPLAPRSAHVHNAHSPAHG
mmetsp:Transcript_5709/g.14540  ORF Transcript_5709/g.14540 Transcript_5709/m.14540 type:complete len:381 (+) Transcript_5709:117-1259(+)